MMNSAIIEDCANNNNPEKNPPGALPENVDVAALMRFMQQMKIPELFARLPDSRHQSKITYPLSSLALWSLATCLFRQGSKNALYTTLKQLLPEQRAGMLHFLGISGKELPHYSTVDDALARVDYEKLNQILLELFGQMNKKKIFYNHAARLLPNNSYHIGTDGYHVHTYSHPHAVDENGNNSCPYCLSRRHHAGTDHEKVYWVHIVVTFMFICGDFKIPLYAYPLKAQQVHLDQSDEKLKQECELTAAYAVLSLIRQKFPKLHFTFLGDGLYANRPFIRFCVQLKMDYIIVRKENSLTTVGKKCDELKSTELYQKFYTVQETEKIKNKKIKRKAAWFNGIDLGDGQTTNVLRFEEESETETKVFSKYNCEWLCSKRCSKNNCFERAKRGRLRWGQEDFHNTEKNRGFDISHDMVRTNPGLLFTWKIMAFIAFFVFEIFSLAKVAREARGSRSLMKFAKDMLQQLVNIAWDKIKESTVLKNKKIQFRLCFLNST